MSHIDALVEGNLPMPERKKSTPSDVEEKIGNNIAENLVAEGATLQMGESLLIFSLFVFDFFAFMVYVIGDFIEDY